MPFVVERVSHIDLPSLTWQRNIIAVCEDAEQALRTAERFKSEWLDEFNAETDELRQDSCFELLVQQRDWMAAGIQLLPIIIDTRQREVDCLVIRKVPFGEILD